MYVTIKGLVLRVVNYNDKDALLTVLTYDHGKITVKARGARRRNSPLAAVCQFLAYGEFTLFEYRGMYTINDAAVIEFFEPLRKDIQRLSLGTYFAQVAEVVSQEDMPNPAVLSLILNCLFALTDADANEWKIKGIFELRIAVLAGYEPDLSACGCGNAQPDRIDLTAGRLECSCCKDPDSLGIRVPVSAGVLDCLRYICACDSKKLLSFSAGEATLASLSSITEAYLSTQLERGFSALDFYKSLLIEPS